MTRFLFRVLALNKPLAIELKRRGLEYSKSLYLWGSHDGCADEVGISAIPSESRHSCHSHGFDLRR